MADNKQAGAAVGSGPTFATDEIGGVDYPRAKIVWGVDGTATDASASNPLPVVQTGTPGLPTGAATAAKQDTEIASLATLAGAVDGTEVQVDVLSSALPTGAATEATLAAASAKLPAALGQAAMAASMSVVIANNQSNVPTSDGGGSHTVDSPQLPAALGQTTAAASVSVVLASDQAAIPTTDGGGSHTIDSPQLPATLGQKAMAASMAVTLASDQSTLPVSLAALPASTNTLEVVGDAAHDAAIAGNPVRVAGRAMSADFAAVATGDTADLLATLLGKLVTIPYALPANTWSYAAPAGGLVSQTAVTIKAAAGAGVRNYVTGIQVINSHQTISSELMLLDGAAGTVLHRGWAQAAGGGYACTFDPPLRGTANTLLEIDEVTATGAAGLLVNVQGFTAAE